MRTKFVTREDYITKEDREVWNRFRATWQTEAPVAGADEGIDGTDASLIAAFLDERLTEEDRMVFERRLAEESVLLEALLAAKTGLHSGPTQSYAVPDSILVWASNTFAAEVSSRRRPTASAAPRRDKRRLVFRPAIAAIGVSLVLIVAAGVGTVLLTGNEPNIVAQADRTAGEMKRSGDKWGPPKNNIFSDPENAYFDGLKID